jgi:ABC-2 type transport system permease protein
MLLTMLRFEFSEWFRSATFYRYAVLFFALPLFAMAGSAGFFEAGSTSGALATAPLALYQLAKFFFKLLLLVTPAFLGVGLVREVAANLHPLLFSFPITKSGFLYAKFLSSFVMLLLLELLLLGGILAGTLIPGVNDAQIGAIDPGSLANLFFGHHLPTLLVVSCFVFVIVLQNWNVYSAYVGIFALFVLREIINRLTGGAYGGFSGGFFDPFAETIIEAETAGWTYAQRETQALPLPLLLVQNRLFWLLNGLLLFFAAFTRFEFATAGKSSFSLNRKPERTTKNNFATVFELNLPDVLLSYSFANRIKTLFLLAKSDFVFVTKSSSFAVFSILGGLFIAVILLNMNPVTDTRLLPTTAQALGFPVFFFSFVIQSLTFLYAGMVMQRARAARMDDLIASTPVPDWVLYGSKLLSMVLLQASFCVAIIAVSAGIQLNQGFYAIDLPLYVQSLFGMHLIGWVLWAVAALFVQNMVSNPFTGLFLLILGVLALLFLSSRPGYTPVFLFNFNPDSGLFLNYSAFNGYGDGLRVFYLYKAYWTVFAVFLAGITLVFWRRFRAFSLVERLREIQPRLISATGWTSAVALSFFLTAGFWIYLQERSPENSAADSHQEARLITSFQSGFGAWKTVPQPKIDRVFFEMDLMPDRRSYEIRGSYVLKNQSAVAIDSVMIKSGFYTQTSLNFSVPQQIRHADSVLLFSIHRFQHAIRPGDSLVLSFVIKNKPNTLFQTFSPVLSDGSYIKSEVFPAIGYFADEAENTTGHHYQRYDSDRITIESLIRAPQNQTVLAPGKRIRAVTDGAFTGHHFKTEYPIKFVFGILSAHYVLVEDTVAGKHLQLYHHPDHAFSKTSFLDGLKQSLAYHTSFFGAYPGESIQLAEFPRSFGTFATTAAQTIPVSETRFLQDLSAAETTTDLAFYVAAHELSHQWWGNALLPAAAPGASMLTESLAEYCTVKIYEQQFGKEAAQRFLAIQKQRYEAGRAAETGVEPPLWLVLPHQTYLSYGKGALAFYALSDLIGEEKLNHILRAFLEEHRNKGAPYPAAVQLIDKIRAEIGPEAWETAKLWF